MPPPDSKRTLTEEQKDLLDVHGKVVKDVIA